MDNKKVVDIKKDTMPILDMDQVQKTIATITTLVASKASLKAQLNGIDDEIKTLQASDALKAVMPLLDGLKAVTKAPRVKQSKKGYIKKDNTFSIDNGITFFDTPLEISYKRDCYKELATLTGLTYNDVTLSGAVKGLIEWLKA